jgi:hypothetical protein
LLKLLQDRGIISKKQGYREPVRTSSFKEWSKQHTPDDDADLDNH